MDLNRRESALFEGLNAKKMSLSEIAGTFVVPPQFDHVVGSDHSFLVGPRGSGKTTILRMLQGEALSMWRHPKAADTRRRVNYTSIFVPADRLWSSQIDVDPADASGVNLGVAAFGTQLLAALVEALQYRLDYFDSGAAIHLPAKLESRAEAELVETCARSWRLRPRTRTLNGLLDALDARLHSIGSAISGDQRAKDELRGDGLPISPLEDVRVGIRSINRATREPGHRWALLLDEMEIAPSSVHDLVLNGVRGGESSLILKMSFSPFDNAVNTVMRGPLSATTFNDFVPVYLWSGDRKGGRKFADSMFRSMLEERVGSDVSPFRVLGASQIDASGRNWIDSDFEKGSSKNELITRMAVEDASFANYLDRRNVDVFDLGSLTYDERSATIRRFFPALVFRDALLRFSSSGTQRRSRKKVDEVFSGQEVVYAALESNPRWMKSVYAQILSAYQPARQRVSYGAQYDALKDAAGRFEALLELLPVESGERELRLLPLLDTVAQYFNRRALGPFSVDFPTTFVVDDAVPDSVRRMVYLALNAGAIVHIRNPSSPPLLSDLTGEKFRLTYLLAIRDGKEMPLRLGKSVPLSRILNDQGYGDHATLNIFGDGV